jgi:hypothetical protein
MKTATRFAAAAFAAMVVSATADAGTSIDMNDPLRAKARENDVRIDAQLVTGIVAPGAPIGVNWQLQNESDVTVAVATRVVDATYDADSQTITLAIGSEVPKDGNMPQMVLVGPGETKVFRASATPAIAPAAFRGNGRVAPRLVQVKVSILRELEPFLPLIKTQSPAAKVQHLSDELFDQWFESTDTILLNTIPVQWSPRANRVVDVERRSARF